MKLQTFFLCVALLTSLVSSAQQTISNQPTISKDQAIAAMNAGNTYHDKKPAAEKFGIRIEAKKTCMTCPGATHETVGVTYLYSPTGWIALQAAMEARQYKQMKFDDLNDDMLRPVLRVVAPSKSPGNLGKVGPYMSESHKQKIVGGYSVTRVVLTNKSKSAVLQPAKETPITEESQNLIGAKFDQQGLLAEFNLDDVKKFAYPEPELYVTIVKTDGDEARCKIMRQDLMNYLNEK